MCQNAHRSPNVAFTGRWIVFLLCAALWLVSCGVPAWAHKVTIEESLDRKLAPILNMLADSLDRGPRVSEVIGGIGYIFGLVGVALYFSTRSKRK